MRDFTRRAKMRYCKDAMTQVARSGRQVTLLCKDAQQARRLVRALDGEALRTLEVVGAAGEQGEGAQWHVVWREGQDWPAPIERPEGA